MLFERLRKSRRRLVTDARRDLWDGVVARFEHQRGLVHPSRHEVTVHRLADKPGKASGEGRAAKPHMAPQLPESPRAPRMFVDQAEAPCLCTDPRLRRASHLRPDQGILSNCAALRQRAPRSFARAPRAGRGAEALLRSPSVAGLSPAIVDLPRASSAGPAVAIPSHCRALGATD